MRMFSLVACLLVSVALLYSNAISVESPDWKQFVVDDWDPDIPDMIPQAVWEDARVQDAFKRQDPEAYHQALMDAINALPPEAQARMGSSFVVPDIPGMMPQAVWEDARVQDAFKRQDPEAYHQALMDAINALPPEAQARMGPYQFMDDEFDPRFITPEMLRAGVAMMATDDPQEHRRILQEAIPSLPEELQQQLAYGFQIVDESNIPPPTPPGAARMSVDEALASLPDGMRESLRGYEDRLVDERTLFRALGSMPKEAVKAALRAHELRFPDPVKEKFDAQLKARVERTVATTRELGYYPSKKQIPEPEELLMRIRQVHLMRGSEPGPPPAQKNPPSPFAAIPEFAAFREFAAFQEFAAFRKIAEYEQISGNPAPYLPAYGIPAGTEAYIGPRGTDGMARVFADSDFGGPLAITENPADKVIYPNPNLTVFGRDASVQLIKYRDGGWSTYVRAFDGQRSFRVGVAARLEGQQRDDFIRFARDVIENR